MNIYIFEDQKSLNFEPISLTRPVFDIRIGSETFLERIQSLFPDSDINLFVRKELEDLTKNMYPNFEVNPESVNEGLWLLGNVIWEPDNLSHLTKGNYIYYSKDNFVAANLTSNQGKQWLKNGGPTHTIPEAENKNNIEVGYCEFLWEIIENIPNTISYESTYFKNSKSNLKDFSQLRIDTENIFAKKCSIQKSVFFDTSKGPILIENGAEINGPSYLQGPLYLGSNTIVEPLTKIKNSVIGPLCKIGGEIDTVIIQSNTNKVHEGHLGDAFLGEWVNLGAGTINSNLKNNYESVKVHINYQSVDTGKIHVGCFIGDHVKTAIGTLINSGTVIGPGTMIATDGFFPKTIKPFTWFVKGKHHKVDFEKFIKTAEIVKNRRGQKLLDIEKQLLKKIKINCKSKK